MGNNVYQIVTDRIITELEKGVVPWHKPWTGTQSGAYSHSTGKPYSLLNQLLLGRPGEYITWSQVKAEGGNVRQGEKSSVVVFWKPQKVKERDTETGEEREKLIPILRYFNVFHIDQCEGIKAKYAKRPLEAFQPIERAEMVQMAYVSREGVRLSYVAGDRACYSPSADRVTLPLREQFQSADEFYSTLFHELAHSTGHRSRLNRFTGSGCAAFGSNDYGKEELVAEIAAASILNVCGIETRSSFQNSASYIDNWLRAIRGDNRLIVSAAGKAEKASNLILGGAGA